MDDKGCNNGKTLQDKFDDLLKLQNNSQVIAFYDDWASSYEKTISTETQYKAPQVIAETAGLLVPKEERQLCRVLDVAAGTGWVGRELSKIGFRNLDALEPSEGMLKKLTETGLYNNKYKEVIGVTNTDSKVPEGVYDLVVVAGAMIRDHIEVSGVDHMIRFAKPGGLLVMVTDYEVVEYWKKLEAQMDQLEERGFVKKISERVYPNNCLNCRGVVYSLRVM